LGPDVRDLKRFLARGALVAAALLLFLSALTLPRLGSWLVSEDPLQKADAMIVLGGTMYERLLEAVDLHKEGWAPRIYLFREVIDWGEVELIARGIRYPRPIDMQLELLGRLGVEDTALHVLDQAGSTAEEATHVYNLAAGEKFSRVIIISSKQHTRRARLVMNRRLDDLGVQVIVRASRYDKSPVDRWWSDRSTLRFTLFETQRLLGYWIGIAD
jgi:uncharacterized SAM-binding protein YcdF (DUF218 family)